MPSPEKQPAAIPPATVDFDVAWPAATLLREVHLHHSAGYAPSTQVDEHRRDAAANGNVYTLQDTTANPAPLGLLGFGMTTVLLNLHNAGFFPLDAMILGMGIFYGGIGQIIVGVMEWKKNNTFGATAFTSYGLFWLTLVALILLPKTGMVAASSSQAMGFYLSCWGMFSFILFLGTFRLNRAMQVVFGSVTVLFILLAAADFTGNHAIKVIAGYEGIFCGLSAIYTGFEQVISEVFNHAVITSGVVK